MKLIGEVEYKKVLVDELRYLDKFCKTNNITYYLFYGTLIGAMRHEGFIPWDDDLDIIMFRNDYDRFCKIFNESSDRYKLVSTETNPDFTAPLAKVIDTKTYLKQNYGYDEKVELGVYIDVFVLDDLPEGEANRNNYYDQSLVLTENWRIANHKLKYDGDSYLKCILRYIRFLPKHIHGYKYYLDCINKHAIKYNNTNSSYVANLTFSNVPKENAIYKRDDFKIEKAMFEGIECPIPSGYDRLLTISYGDWKKLPPENERVSHHAYECYWRED